MATKLLKIRTWTVGHHYLGVTHTKMSSAVHTHTQVKARFSILAIVAADRYHFISLAAPSEHFSTFTSSLQ